MKAMTQDAAVAELEVASVWPELVLIASGKALCHQEHPASVWETIAAVEQAMRASAAG